MARLVEVDLDKIKLFLAAKYWIPLSRPLATKLGYGVLYENGHDLTVQHEASVDEV